MRFFKYMTMFFLMFFFGADAQSQDRQAAVAGQFYPADAASLRSDLSSLFAKSIPRKSENVLAIICPHAGYVFSGEVAASSFNQIDPDKKYEHIFILASSHRMAFEGASIYDAGDYVTPLGKVKVDRKLADELISKYKVFNNRTDAHANEHSLEVQLPFLQYKLGNEIQIIPIILGTQTEATCRKIGEALKPYLNSKNLFVISTDFSHYPDYDDAVKNDRRTAEAICRNSASELVKVLKENDDRNIPDLATSLCGWTSVLSMLYMTEGRKDLDFKIIQYKNSGDNKLYGEKDRVVGYNSIVIEQKNSDGKDGFSLDEKDKKELLRLARLTVNEYVRKRRTPEPDTLNYSDALMTPCGAFVTLMKDDNLRGCIGRFDADAPLYAVVIDMAIAAATQDYRFPAVSPDEIDDLEIEISVLTPLKKINSIDEFELGVEGIYIKKGGASGTFLPQVADQTGWTKEEFLGHCAQDKARIGWNGWKDADLFTYKAIVFSEKEF